MLIYHANSEWLAGGFLGVEVFFVISGYLITLLLMAERERTGTVRLGAFWMRRARRLLPALFVMLFLLLTYTWIFKADTLGKLRGDMLGGLLYVSNWYQIWVGQGYSASGDFAPLRHLWSLGVEEQFYLVWPIVMLLLLRRNGTRNLALTARWLVLAALVVTVVMAVLYHPGRIGECSINPEAYWTVGERCISKADALYLSTITRSSGLLLGAAFAMIWRPVAIMRGPLRSANRLLDLVAVVGLLLLGLFAWKLHFVTPAGADPWLFRGGFLWHRHRHADGDRRGHPPAHHDQSSARQPAAALDRHALVRAVPLLTGRSTRSSARWPGNAAHAAAVRGRDGGRPRSSPSCRTRYVETPIRRREVGRWWDSLRRRRDPVPRQIWSPCTVVVSMVLLAFGVLRLGLAELEAERDRPGARVEGEQNVTVAR